MLTGRAPENLPPGVIGCQAIPQVTKVLPVGDGTALIRRRPDVREAERTLHGSVALIGVATADLFPTVSLGGNAARTSAFGATSTTYSFGPLVSWTFPNVLPALARVRQARAVAEGDLARFDGTVLGALQETETALSAYARELDRHAALRAAGDQSAQAFALANLTFQVGRTSFLNTLDAERTLATAEANLAQSEAAISEDQIAVFKALGGGWEDAPPVARQPYR